MEKWRELISQPVYKTVAEKDVLVVTRDGVRIAVDVYRPESGSKFPALIAMSPYSKDTQAMPTTPTAGQTPLGRVVGSREYRLSSIQGLCPHSR